MKYEISRINAAFFIYVKNKTNILSFLAKNYQIYFYYQINNNESTITYFRPKYNKHKHGKIKSKTN